MLALFPGFDDIEKFIYNSFLIQMQGNKFALLLDSYKSHINDGVKKKL